MLTNKPEAVLKTWMQAINAGDLERVLALYNEKAVLIPTFSNRLLDRPEKIREYFERLCLRDELSLAFHEKTLIVQSVQDEVHSLCGIYCWRFAVEGELLSFEARFSWLVNLALPSPILQHHSSQIPRTL
jgi:hypothetical protein